MGAVAPLDRDTRRLDVSSAEFARRLSAHGHDPASIDRLWRELAEDDGGGERAPTSKSLGLGPSIAVYLGVLLLLAAIASVLAIYWETLDPWGVIAIGCVAIVGFIVTGEVLSRRQLDEPAGVLEAVAVCLVPLVVYGVEEAAGLWPDDTDVDYVWSGITVIALSTGAAAIGMLVWRPGPLLLVPLGAATALLAADGSEVALGADATLQQHFAFVLPVGVLWIAGGLWLDVSGTRRYATWAHWVGLAITGVSVMVLVPKTVPGFAVVGVLGAAALFFSVFVRHWSFAAIGALGVLVAVGGALGMLGGAAPLALVVLGLGFVVAGLRWSRWRDRLRVAVLAHLPPRVRSLLVHLAP